MEQLRRANPVTGMRRSLRRIVEELAATGHLNEWGQPHNAMSISRMLAGQPVISVDTKKEELVGNYKNAGSDYRPKGSPLRVKVHDFENKELGKVAPYGVYDVTANVGFVNLGIMSDTAEFAVQSIRTWRERMGLQRYPNMRELTITADCGGSNGARVRLWKVELQKLADDTGLTVHVHHFPPGTSKLNKFEHGYSPTLPRTGGESR